MITRIRFLAVALALAASAAFAQFVVPFLPQGTTNIAVTGTAQSLSIGTSTLPSTLTQLVLTNVGTQTVFYRADGTAATTANGMPILANSSITVSVPASTTALSVISSTTGSVLYSTVGAGR